jgi:hypothetical protein
MMSSSSSSSASAVEVFVGQFGRFLFFFGLFLELVVGPNCLVIICHLSILHLAREPLGAGGDTTAASGGPCSSCL